ncbi:hypothetical protein DFH09DRAFT_1100713 [Mycena vulgaris]|nr:hypothetical protein DFH09DRAFT_1100713 [Mycena vulgaris]
MSSGASLKMWCARCTAAYGGGSQLVSWSPVDSSGRMMEEKNEAIVTEKKKEFPCLLCFSPLALHTPCCTHVNSALTENLTSTAKNSRIENTSTPHPGLGFTITPELVDSDCMQWQLAKPQFSLFGHLSDIPLALSVPRAPQPAPAPSVSMPVRHSKNCQPEQDLSAPTPASTESSDQSCSRATISISSKSSTDSAMRNGTSSSSSHIRSISATSSPKSSIGATSVNRVRSTSPGPHSSTGSRPSLCPVISAAWFFTVSRTIKDRSYYGHCVQNTSHEKQRTVLHIKPRPKRFSNSAVDEGVVGLEHSNQARGEGVAVVVEEEAEVVEAAEVETEAVAEVAEREAKAEEATRVSNGQPTGTHAKTDGTTSTKSQTTKSASTSSTSSSASSTLSSSSASSSASSCSLRRSTTARPTATASAITGRANDGITACGVPVRKDNVKTLCEQKAVKFGFSNGVVSKTKHSRRASDTDSESDSDTDDSEDEEPEDPNDRDFSPSPEPDGKYQCDHVLELQVLKKTLESNGVCDALDAIIATPNSGLISDDKEAYMAAIKDAINSKNNLFLLDSKLNQVKRDEVTASLKGKTPATSANSDLNEQYIAVNDYLTDSSVTRPSTSMASKLDTLVQAIVKQAGDDALKNIKGCGTTANQQQLTQARAKFKPPGVPSVTSSWKDVLDYVAKQAALADASCSNSQSSKRANCNRPSSSISSHPTSFPSSASAKSSAPATSRKPLSTKYIIQIFYGPRPPVTESATPTASATHPTTSSSIDPKKARFKITFLCDRSNEMGFQWYTLTRGNNNYLNSVNDALTSINYVSLDPPEPGMQFQFPDGLSERVVWQAHTDKTVGIFADNKTWSTNADASLASTLGTAGSRNVSLAFNGMSVGGDGSALVNGERNILAAQIVLVNGIHPTCDYQTT